MRRSLLLAVVLTVGALGAERRAAAAPGDRRVPEVIDLPLAQAIAELSAGGFGADAKDAPPDAGPIGTIARQEPGGFAFAPPGSKVAIYVRGGAGGSSAAPGPSSSSSTPPASSSTPSGVPYGPTPPPTSTPTPDRGSIVPDVRGKTEAEAIELLTGWRITILTVDSVAANEGRVTNQSPAAGSSLSLGEVVEISVGRTGTPPAPAGTSIVPQVVGLTQEAATQALSAARLVPMVEYATTGDATRMGRVLSQDRAPNSIVSRDSNIVIVIGRAAAVSLNEAEVPDCSRQPEAAARKKLADAGFVAVVKDRLAGAGENGTVVEQSPAPMTRLLKGREVTLVVGRLLMLPIAVPDVMSADAAAAERALRDAGFEVERVLADTLPSGVGKVIAEEPAGGSMRVRGSFVRITVGRSSIPVPSTVAVPDVIGRYEAQIRADLQARGFGVRVNLVPGAPADAGKVRSQNPTPGALVAPGSEIVLEVVRAETVQPGVTLPNSMNMDAAAAQADLQARGLRVAIAYTTGSPDGFVIGQLPAPGTVTVPGALVTLTVARAPSLGVPALLEPAHGTSLPRNHGVVFRWGPVQDAEDYQIEVMSWKDDTWQRENQYELRDMFLSVRKARLGLYQWHVRARRAGGTILGPWSEWRRLRVY